MTPEIKTHYVRWCLPSNWMTQSTSSSCSSAAASKTYTLAFHNHQNKTKISSNNTGGAWVTCIEPDFSLKAKFALKSLRSTLTVLFLCKHTQVSAGSRTVWGLCLNQKKGFWPRLFLLHGAMCYLNHFVAVMQWSSNTFSHQISLHLNAPKAMKRVRELSGRATE